MRMWFTVSDRDSGDLEKQVPDHWDVDSGQTAAAAAEIWQTLDQQVTLAPCEMQDPMLQTTHISLKSHARHQQILAYHRYHLKILCLITAENMFHQRSPIQDMKPHYQ